MQYDFQAPLSGIWVYSISHI